jgi:branched-chain amino acid transport system ATP-binding protein
MAGLLEIGGLEAFYGQTQALFGIDLELEPGSITTILGANGAGKTTVLRAISGLVRTRGRISFTGRRLEQLSPEAIARLKIAHAPDGRGTFLGLSVADNLRLGAYTRRDPAGIRADLERVEGYFPVLAERRRQQAGTLSGGEQQMLAIGRALMLRPRLLLLDEPSFGLAPLVIREIFRILGRINREDRVSMLLVEQNTELALGLADHAYLLETGRIVRAGTAAELGADPGIRQAYLGYA